MMRTKPFVRPARFCRSMVCSGSNQYSAATSDDRADALAKPEREGIDWSKLMCAGSGRMLSMWLDPEVCDSGRSVAAYARACIECPRIAGPEGEPTAIAAISHHRRPSPDDKRGRSAMRHFLQRCAIGAFAAVLAGWSVIGLASPAISRPTMVAPPAGTGTPT